MEKLYRNIILKVGHKFDFVAYLEVIQALLANLLNRGFFTHGEITYIKRAIQLEETYIED